VVFIFVSQKDRRRNDLKLCHLVGHILTLLRTTINDLTNFNYYSDKFSFEGAVSLKRRTSDGDNNFCHYIGRATVCL